VNHLPYRPGPPNSGTKHQERGGIFAEKTYGARNSSGDNSESSQEEDDTGKTPRARFQSRAWKWCVHGTSE